MSRPPLQGRVEEIIIREPKPSWSSRIGDVLGDVFSGIGSAVREYGPALLQGLANANLYNTSSNSYQSYDIGPSPLPDYSSSSRTVRITAPEPIKPRPLPEPRQAPRLMETYGRSLQQRRNQCQQQIEDLMATNEQAANRRGIAGQLGQYVQPGAYVQPSRRQPSVDIHPSQSSSHSLADYLNPSRSHSIPVQEDYGWIQANLAGAQRPVTWQEQAMRQQAQQQALHHQQVLDAQIQSAHKQRELAKAQTRMLQEQQYQEHQALRQQLRAVRLPESVYRDRQAGKTNVTELALQGKIPSDKQLEQLFHTLNLKWHQADNQFTRMQAERNQAIVMELLATNMSVGPWANLNKDGYVIIGNQAYGKGEAYQAALADLNHFKQAGEHLPSKYPTTPPRNPSDTRGYPDVTELANQKIHEIKHQTSQTYHAYGVASMIPLFYTHFPNNGPWDLQVEHGLPGQVPKKTPQGDYVRNPDGTVQTVDQYAVFNGKVVRAGYISNYAYGQAAAAGELPLTAALAAAQVIAGSNDNPDDVQAIKDGYKQYRKDHPYEVSSPGSFRNK